MVYRVLFTTALTITSRFVQVRDHLLGRVPRTRPDHPGISASDHIIVSGKNRLDSVYVEPSAAPPRAAVLICHGIGEVVSQWFPIQQVFAHAGIASLVFDYSGYGQSTGLIDWPQLEIDAVSAFQFLRSLRTGVPICLLGFSLGTGIAAAVLDRVAPDRLILCAGFSSFRSAARSARIPSFLSFLVPPIWSAEPSLSGCRIPILIVQGDNDRLFRMPMARELVACSGARAELLLLPARKHNGPFYDPQPGYWSPIISWMLQGETPSAKP